MLPAGFKKISEDEELPPFAAFNKVGDFVRGTLIRKGKGKLSAFYLIEIDESSFLPKGNKIGVNETEALRCLDEHIGKVAHIELKGIKDLGSNKKFYIMEVGVAS